MIRHYVGDWRWLGLRGLIAALIGVVTLIWPAVTLTVLVVLFGVFVLVDGILGIGAVLTGGVRSNRGWWVLYGLAGIAVGILTFAWPQVTALVLLFLIAAWALAIGLLLVVTAIRLRREIQHEWVLGIMGVLSLAVGVALIAAPVAGALAITWLIGLYLLLLGILLMVVAWEVRRETRAAPPPFSTRPGTPHTAT